MTSSSSQDAHLFETIKSQLNTALIGDVLDTMGYNQQYLPPTLRPLDSNSKIVGRAMPVLESEYITSAPSDSAPGPLRDRSFGLMMEALDNLQENEIYIASAGSIPPKFAFWGGLMSTRATFLKSAGAIVNGYVRDVDEIARLGFPVWSVGIYSRDQGPRGKVIDYRCPIEIDGVRINPGDLIVADKEGVLIIPHSVAEEVIAQALAKRKAEDGFAEAVKQGMSVIDAFHKFGVM